MNARRLTSVFQLMLGSIFLASILCEARGASAADVEPTSVNAIESVFNESSGRQLHVDQIYRLQRAVDGAWPRQERFGKRAIDQFSSLVLRAGVDPDFQQKMLNSAFTLAGVEISPRRFACLNDLVELSHQRPQQFGMIRDGSGGLQGPAINVTHAEILRSMLAISPLAAGPLPADSKAGTACSFVPMSIAPPTDPELRKRLLVALGLDLEIRRSDGSNDDMARIDRENAAFIRETLSTRGIPGAAEIGIDGVHAMFVLMQHSLDAGERRANLARVQALKDREELSGQDYALFHDRAKVLGGEPQRYGTQAQVVDGKEVLYPIEDETALNARRATMGLQALP